VIDKFRTAPLFPAIEQPLMVQMHYIPIVRWLQIQALRISQPLPGVFDHALTGWNVFDRKHTNVVNLGGTQTQFVTGKLPVEATRHCPVLYGDSLDQCHRA